MYKVMFVIVLIIIISIYLRSNFIYLCMFNTRKYTIICAIKLLLNIEIKVSFFNAEVQPNRLTTYPMEREAMVRLWQIFYRLLHHCIGYYYSYFIYFLNIKTPRGGKVFLYQVATHEELMYLKKIEERRGLDGSENRDKWTN